MCLSYISNLSVQGYRESEKTRNSVDIPQSIDSTGNSQDIDSLYYYLEEYFLEEYLLREITLL